MRRLLGPVAVAVAALAAGGLIYTHRILLGGPFMWDEAAHALRGLLIARDCREGDWLALLYDTYSQVYWPPLHAWLTGAAFLAYGPTITAARSVSLIAFVLLAPTLFFAARGVRSTHGDLAGIVATALALASPALVTYAAQAMLELPALLGFSLTLLIYIRLGHNGVSARAHALLGLGIMLTYFIRLNYGLLLLLAVVLALLIEANFRPRRLLTRSNAYVALPVSLLSAVWFAYPPKVVATWQALINRPWGGPETRGIAGLLFYPRVLLHDSGSVWIFFLFLASFVAAWPRRHNRNVRLFLILIIAQFLICAGHHSKDERYILPVLPPLFLLTGIAVAEWWERWPQHRVVRLAAAAALAGVFVLQARNSLGLVEQSPARPTEEVLEYIAEVVRVTEPTLVLGTMDVVTGPPIIDWHLITRAHLLSVTRAGSLSHVEMERQTADALKRALGPGRLRDEMVRVLTRYDDGAATRSFYLGLPTDIDGARFDTWLQCTLGTAKFGGVVVITSLSDTARYPLSFAAPSLQRAALSHLRSREFTDLRVRVDLYGPLGPEFRRTD